MLDRSHATRDDLIRILLDQQDQLADRDRQVARQAREIAELRQAVALLTERIGTLTMAPDADDPPAAAGSSRSMPGLKPTQAPNRPPRPRTRRAGPGHGPWSHPDAGHRSGGSRPSDLSGRWGATGWGKRQTDGGKRCVPPPQMQGVVTGQGLTSVLGVLREATRIPIRGLATLTGLHLSVGAITAASARIAQHATPTITAIQEAIRANPVVHLDETGWREAGRNGDVWTASTPDQRLFLHGSWQKAMVDHLLGDAFAGVVVSDFSAADTTDERLHQSCWAHLLRDIRELTQQDPQDPVLAGWADGVGAIFHRARDGTVGAPRAHGALRRQCQADLKQLCGPWVAVAVPQRRLCARMVKHLPELFTFVTEPGVPPTHNAAERSLRPLVIARKISGGTRSAPGTRIKMTLASLFGTWRVQGINPYHACREPLTSPQV